MRVLAFLSALLGLAVLSCNVHADQRFSSDAEVDVDVIEPGVFLVHDGNSVKTYASGVSGMRYMVQFYEEQIRNAESAGHTKALEHMVASRDLLVEELRKFDAKSTHKAKGGGASLQVSESGLSCSINYDISATAQSGGFWDVDASATAGFQQHDPLLGPYPMDSTAIVTTYTKVTGMGQILEDGDMASGDTIGQTSPGEYIEADPAYGGGFLSANCMTAEAKAEFTVVDCPNAYRSVVDQYSQYCN